MARNLPVPYDPSTTATTVLEPDKSLFFDFWREVGGRAKTAWDTGSLAEAVKSDFRKYPLTSLPGAAAEGIGEAYARSMDQSDATRTAPGPGNPNAPRKLAQTVKAVARAEVGQPQSRGSSIEEGTSTPEPRPAPDAQLPDRPDVRRGGSLRSRQVARSVSMQKGVRTPKAEANTYDRTPRRSRRRRD